MSDQNFASSNQAERNLVLTQGEYAYIIDQTEGRVQVYVGPHQLSLSPNHQPVEYEKESRRFPECELNKAIKACPYVPDGSYVVLENPARVADGDNQHPDAGTNSAPSLEEGRKVVIPGPVTFPLWPGQSADVIEGHRLRSNEYLIIRIINEEEARKHWAQGIIRSQIVSNVSEPEDKDSENESVLEVSADAEIPDFSTGQNLIIKGTEVSFYIPPTGIAVIKGDKDYVQQAVSLERLEYCTLLGEDGEKRYVHGPAVVFPEPTETFITNHKGNRKFKAFELMDISGIHLKVTAGYEDEDEAHKEGDELFITGNEQKIYVPRREHSIVRYEGRPDPRHYATAIPAGEGRYVLNWYTGEIRLEQGPSMLLPDPRKEIIVRRILDLRDAQLWYPGNQEAIKYNQALQEESRAVGNKYITESTATPSHVNENADSDSRIEQNNIDGQAFIGDEFQRQGTYVPPRTITIDSKYSGAVGINVWTGYAVQVVKKDSTRRVEVGPKPILLEYDETLEIVEFSTKTPKDHENTKSTVYLKVRNQVLDIVEADTYDSFSVRIPVSYRVEFRDDSNKWFDVDNYVKLLTEHASSLIIRDVKKCGVRDFYDDSTDIVRNTILGDPDPETGLRKGLSFHENGLHVYEVDVGKIEIHDDEINLLLEGSQHAEVEHLLEIDADKRKLELTIQKEEINREVEEAINITKLSEITRELETKNREHEFNLAQIQHKREAEQKRLENLRADEEQKSAVSALVLAKERETAEQEQEINSQKQQIELAFIEAQTTAIVAKLQAINPELATRLEIFGNQLLTGELAKHLPEATGTFGFLSQNGGLSGLLQLAGENSPFAQAIRALTGEEREE
tara:strand:+ start:241 stop:2793 length:2553 start_codon:yes stop_codon:yes gene_type:complete